MPNETLEDSKPVKNQLIRTESVIVSGMNFELFRLIENYDRDPVTLFASDGSTSSRQQVRF
jgi:hypothetical protein